MAEAVPLLAAPMIMKGVGAGLAATGLAGMIMQARKQGEGRRSQPVDYGQGGTATPRGKSVQRGRLNSNDAYNRAKREERKKEAQRRARERAEQGIDELIGSEEDRRYAKQKRRERGIEEGLTPEQKKDAKLNYQYKQVTNPKRPVDPIKLLKLKKGTV